MFSSANFNIKVHFSRRKIRLSCSFVHFAASISVFPAFKESTYIMRKKPV
jgi:hypothetical protein